MPAVPYAVVQDVPASWEQYQELAAHLLARPPEGLLYHVAGPTDAGYRTIDVWETQAAWQRFREVAETTCRAALWAAPVQRELAVVAAVYGPALASAVLSPPRTEEP
jgi:hypothetical protein